MKSLQVPSPSRSRIGSFRWLGSNSSFSKSLADLTRHETLKGSSHCFLVLPQAGQPEARTIAAQRPMPFFMSSRQGIPMGMSNNAKPQVNNDRATAAVDPLTVCEGAGGRTGRQHSFPCLKQPFRSRESFPCFLNALQQTWFCFKTWNEIRSRNFKKTYSLWVRSQEWSQEFSIDTGATSHSPYRMQSFVT